MGGNLQYEMQGCIQRRVNNLPRTVPCSPLIKGNVSRGAPWPAGVLNCVCRSSGCSLCKSFHCVVVRSSISSCCSLVHVELKPVTSKKKKQNQKEKTHGTEQGTRAGWCYHSAANSREGEGREGCLSQLIQLAANSEGLYFPFKSSSQNSETRKKTSRRDLEVGKANKMQ